MTTIGVEPYDVQKLIAFYDDSLQVNSCNELVGFEHKLSRKTASNNEAEKGLSNKTLIEPRFSHCSDNVLWCDLIPCASSFFKKVHSGTGNKVKVKVMATIISPERRKLDPGSLFDIFDNDKIENSSFVGKVLKASLGGNLREGLLVTSLRKCSIHAKFITSPNKALIPIPESVDAGEVCALMTYFLPAFRLLHRGRTDPKRRLLKSSLLRQHVLVTGGGSNLADAIVNLSLLGGASRVFVLQTENAKLMTTSTLHNVVLLHCNSQQWQNRIHEKLDLIVDLEYPRHFHSILGLVKENGRVVCRKPENHGNSIFGFFELLVYKAILLQSSNAFLFDINELLDNEHDEIIRDVEFLFRLLSKRKIRPKIDKYIKLQDVGKAGDSTAFSSSRLGAIVFEPST